MTTQNEIKIKKLLKKIPACTVITAQQLNSMGVSHDLMKAYEKSGWLKRIAMGAYTRLDENADLNGALYALQNYAKMDIHLGGLSALDKLYGLAHFLRDNERVHLFATLQKRCPAWFKKVYGNSVDVCYTNFLPVSTGIDTLSFGNFYLKVPSLERALLELLYSVPNEVTVSEAYAVIEMVQSIKVPLMQSLLESCASVKVKRLFLCMVENAGLQWFSLLDVGRIDLGSGFREIGSDGILYSKYNLVIPRLE